MSFQFGNAPSEYDQGLAELRQWCLAHGPKAIQQLHQAMAARANGTTDPDDAGTLLAFFAAFGLLAVVMDIQNKEGWGEPS